MGLVVRAFPLLPGKEDQLRAFAEELKTRRAAEGREFFARFGVSRESWHLQTTPYGTWVIAVTDISGLPVEVVAREYSQSEQPFDCWFKGQVRELSGIDPDEQPLGPPTETIFDTAALPEPTPADA